MNDTEITRRTAIGLLTGGTLLSLSESAGFGTVVADRLTNISVTDDPNALVGLIVNDQVRKNQRELLLEIENNTSATVEFAVSLDDSTQGTLYNGTSTIGPEGSFSVEIEANVKDATIPFTVTGTSPAFGFEATRETTAVTGNTQGAVTIDRLKKFEVDGANERWTIMDIEVSADGELDRVEYEVADAGGTVRASRTDDAAGTEYVRDGTGNNPGVALQPDDPGDGVDNGTTYELTVTAFDTNNNVAVQTVQN